MMAESKDTCHRASKYTKPKEQNIRQASNVFSLVDTSSDTQTSYIESAMILFTISLSFSFNALTAFFLLTLACAITNSISLASNPVSSTSSPSSSSSSSFLASPAPSIALPLSGPWLCPAWSPVSLDWMFLSALSEIWEERSSILASPKMLEWVCQMRLIVGAGRQGTNGREGKGGPTSRCCLRETCRHRAD